MTIKKEISIAFLGTLVPDTEKYQNIAFTRSGNMVQDGIVSGLHKHGVNVSVFSLRPIASYPKDKKLFCVKNVLNYHERLKLQLIPFINILVLKTITGAVYDFFALIKWAIKHRKSKRYIMVYNTYTPPLPFVYWMGKLTGSKSIAILYDLGMPPKQLQLSGLKKLIYRFVEFFAKRYIPRLNGRIVINENIANDYAPGKHFLLVDGGISSSIIVRLFDLVEKKNRAKTVFLCAGSLWGANGTKLIVETLQNNKNPNIEMWFAGGGPDVEYIKSAAQNDERIKYKGKLNLNQLFELYEQADILMNIRVTNGSEGDYLFPSKIIEYLTIGKYVVTTEVAHIGREYGHLCKVLENNGPEKLSLAMDELTEVTGAELLRLGKIARQFMLENHTWEQQSSKIIDYINKLDLE